MEQLEGIFLDFYGTLASGDMQAVESICSFLVHQTTLVRLDGKWLIHKTEITHIKPMSYYKAILENNVQVTEERIEDELAQALDAAA